MLDENEMSRRLVEFCSENETFKKNFVALFADRAGASKVEFTGSAETGFGKPDITITFDDGFCYFIEVKTRSSTGFQENQVDSEFGYANLVKSRKQKLEESLGYLLDNQHDTSECLAAGKVVYWQKILELVNDFGNKALAKDILQNVDGISSDEKLFGPDEEIYSNPYQLALFNDQVLKLKKHDRKDNNWLFKSFIVPALQELGFDDAGPETWADLSVPNAPRVLYATFTKEKKYVWINFNLLSIEGVGDWNFCSFAFYRPWIIGVRTATREAQLKELTKKALRLWLFDCEKNVIGKKSALFEGDFNGKPWFGEKAALYGNPYVFANYIDCLNEGKEIYDDIVVPAIKKIPKLTIVSANFIDAESQRRYICIDYDGVGIKFNVHDFWNSKSDKGADRHSFIFYRPWIVGARRAKTKDEMIECAHQSFEIWLEDLRQDGFLGGSTWKI